MLKLFKIQKNVNSEPEFFQYRKPARIRRDELIEEGHNVVVMRGPDHWKGESFNIPQKTPGRKDKRND